jgi:predicted ATPase/transcriptional regulator with XRE-family HTH domain
MDTNTLEFRDRVKSYRRATGFSQKDLAKELGVQHQVLSRKLGFSGHSRLTHQEIKKLIKTLVAWKAINTETEVVELLSLLSLTSGFFTSDEWNSFPLKDLEVGGTPAAIPQPLVLPAFADLKTNIDKSFNNLPTQLNRLIGRQPLINQVRELFLQTSSRLLTFVGIGGSGKTRLALQAGQELQKNFRHGVCFVDLSQVTNPALVPGIISQALGLVNAKGLTPLQTLKNYLAHREMLLIVDNFEHVLECVDLVVQLLASAAGLKIIVTSRIVLHVYGEHEFSVPPLELPNLAKLPKLAELAEYEAIKLFVERARTVKSDFRLDEANALAVARICTELNGLPLALELAAARIKLLPPDLLLEFLITKKLDLLTGGAANHPPRQQTIRNTLDWSYNLLSFQEQRLLARLSVFRDSFSFEAACEVCLDTNEPVDKILLLDQLTSLVDKSLIRREGTASATDTASVTNSLSNQLEQDNLLNNSTRFNILEVLREYALEQLNLQQDFDNTRLRHIAYYCKLAKQAQIGLTGPAQVSWLTIIAQEQTNFRIALQGCLMSSSTSTPKKNLVEAGLVIANGLFAFWDIRSYYSEARTYLEQLLGQAEQVDLTANENYAWGLNRAGILAGRQGEYANALLLLEKSLNLHRRLGDRTGEANSLNYLGVFNFMSGKYTQARTFHNQSLELFRAIENKNGTGLALVDLGIAQFALGNATEAIECYLQALMLFEELGDKRRIGTCLANLGYVHCQQQNYSAAVFYHQKCLALHTELGDRRALSYTLRYLGAVAYYQSDYFAAYKHLVESLNLSERLGDKFQTGTILAILASTCYRLSSPNSEVYSEQLCIVASLLGTVNGQLLAGAALPPEYQTIYMTTVQETRKHLGEALFISAYTSGQNFSVYHVVEHLSLHPFLAI